MNTSEKLSLVIERGLALLEAGGYRGHDPYDALLSPLARLLPGAKARLLFTHGVRKFPWNLRPLLGVKKTLNPKTLALCLDVYARLGRGGQAQGVIGLLEETFPWAYPFPWQSRAFYVPSGTPTSVNTAFVLHGLLDARERLGLDTGPLVRRGAENILRVLNRSPDGFFSYTPMDNYRIHNANLLLASALARAGLEREARTAAQASLKLQRPDGSWPYGEDYSMFGYIDNFHTGFVILALLRLRRDLGEEIGEPLERALRFYRSRLFDEEGIPLWRTGRKYPLDIHTFAVAAGVLAEAGDGDRARGIAEHLLRLFLRKDGSFGYQRGRFLYHGTNFARWGQAWALWALVRLLKP